MRAHGSPSNMGNPKFCGTVGVTQPRVVVLATTKRVLFELDRSLGKEVGFQVRHDQRIGDSFSIKFMTWGNFATRSGG